MRVISKKRLLMLREAALQGRVYPIAGTRSVILMSHVNYRPIAVYNHPQFLCSRFGFL